MDASSSVASLSRRRDMFCHARDIIRRHVYQKSQNLRNKAKVCWLSGTVDYSDMFAELMDIGYQYGVHYFMLEYEFKHHLVHSIYLKNVNQYNYVRVSSDGRTSLDQDSDKTKEAVHTCVFVNGDMWIGNHHYLCDTTMFLAYDDVEHCADVETKSLSFLPVYSFKK